MSKVANFFRGEQLGNTMELKFGACRCGRCPMSGSRYSFREEAKLKGLTTEILEFFDNLYNLEELVFPRSLWPEEDTEGGP